MFWKKTKLFATRDGAALVAAGDTPAVDAAIDRMRADAAGAWANAIQTCAVTIGMLGTANVPEMYADKLNILIDLLLCTAARLAKTIGEQEPKNG